MKILKSLDINKDADSDMNLKAPRSNTIPGQGLGNRQNQNPGPRLGQKGNFGLSFGQDSGMESDRF